MYKLNSSEKMMIWNISVIKNSDHSTAYDIYISFGQEDGKIQETFDTIFEGKNIGKKNETTVKEQAELEAEAKWKKQFDKGYMDSREAAEFGESKLAVVPMLAQSYDKHPNKIKFPCYTQPKLDGIRCLAVCDPDAMTVKLYSRKGKSITSMAHIEKALKSQVLPRLSSVVTLDGELYNHELKSEFEKIVSKVRKEEPSEGCELIQYHIYDVVDTEKEQKARFFMMDNVIFEMPEDHSDDNPLQMVALDLAVTSREAKINFHSYLDNGYEGAMLRNVDSFYETKRSYNLQKYKVFDDAEFKIVGIEEGRGKLQGHAAAFVLTNEEGSEFKAKLDGSQDFLKQCFEDHSLWEGKLLTVQYQGLTSKERVPRFPVGKAIRDYE